MRGRDCFVVQSTCRPVDEHLMELLIYLDCLRRASAKRITAVIPYFGYARQDRKDEGRVPITAKLVANLITTAGADRVLAIDLHAHQLQGFFDIPVDHLTGELVLSRYFRDKKIEDLAVVSPDVGNIKTAARYAGAPRRRSGDRPQEADQRLAGPGRRADRLGRGLQRPDVRRHHRHGRHDLHGGRAGQAARRQERPRGRHARRVRPPALERLEKAPIDEVVVTNTIPLTEEAKTDQEDQGPERGGDARRGDQADSPG